MSNKIALDALTKFVKNAEQSVFEDWLEAKSPSGDVEQVQSQWESSNEYREFCEREWAVPLSAAIAALEAMEAGGWLPISEAPKGRKVLAGYKNKLGNWRTVTARYYLPQTLLLEDDRDDLDDDGYAPEGWYEESETQEVILRIEEPPTHFQPLPTPPKEAP